MTILPQKVPFAPSPTLTAAVTEAASGRRPTQWFQRVGGGGYTPAHRLIVTFSDGSTAFVKAAVDTKTAAWIRAELRVYQSLGRQSFLPAFFGGAVGDDAFPESTVLLLEELSAGFWPPPWTAERINAVLEALQSVHHAAPLSPPPLPTLTQSLAGEPSWAQVAADPTPFLALNFCSSSWLEKALPVLIKAAASIPSDGTDLLHQDIRSDNLCFRADGSAVLVDWNWACHRQWSLRYCRMGIEPARRRRSRAGRFIARCPRVCRMAFRVLGTASRTSTAARCAARSRCAASAVGGCFAVGSACSRFAPA